MRPRYHIGRRVPEGEVRAKPSRGCACAQADTIPGQVMASAATAATTARRKSGEGIMARRLHLTDARSWRGHVEQNGLFRPAPNNCPDRACPPPLKVPTSLILVLAKTFVSARIWPTR